MVDMDFLSALFSGQTGTDDLARAGIAQIPQAEAALPPPIPPPSIPPPSFPPPSIPTHEDLAGADNQASPRVLATLGNARPVQAPGGGDLPVNLIGPQTGPYAAMQQVAQNAQGGSQQAAPPPQAAAPQSNGTPAATSYGPLMDRILRQIDAREKSGWSDNLLRFGLAAMAAGGKPGATTLGALGEGGLSALSAQDANRGQDLKALLSGAQASNLLSETALRQNQIANQSNLPPIPGLGPAPASGGAAGAAPSGTQGPLPPNMTKIASTLSQLGHNPAQIAGALGWATAESGAQDTNTRSLNNTGKDGQLGGSYGWQQWLAERRDQLKDFAKSQSGRVDDPVIQAKFFDQEMRTPGSGAGKAAQSAYWNANSPDQAVVAMAHYGRGEGYSPDNPQGTLGFGKRLAAAQQIYGSIAGSGAPPPSAGSASQNGAIVTAPQAFAMGRRLEGAGFKEEAAAWFKYADPQFNPSIVGATEVAKNVAKYAEPQFDPRIVGATEAAKEGQKIQHTNGYIMRGGQIVGAVPRQVEVTDAAGNESKIWVTPPIPGNAPVAADQPGAAATAGAAPNAGQIGPGLTTKIGPGEHERLVKRGMEEETQRQAVISEAGAAQTQQAALQNMRDSAPNIIMGPFAPHAQEASRWLRYVSPSFEGQVANYEDFTKNAGIVLRKVTSEVSSREAVQGLMLFKSQLPDTDQSPKGFDRVSSQFMGLNDFKIVKAQAQKDWEDQHQGSVKDFETTFQKQVTPLAFMFMRLSPSDQAELAGKLGSTTEGQALKQKLTQQIGLVKRSGYDAVIQ